MGTGETAAASGSQMCEAAHQTKPGQTCTEKNQAGWLRNTGARAGDINDRCACIGVYNDTLVIQE